MAPKVKPGKKPTAQKKTVSAKTTVAKKVPAKKNAKPVAKVTSTKRAAVAVAKKPAAKTMAKSASKASAKPAAKLAKPKAMKKVSAIPKGYSSITPYLITHDTSKAIAYYTKVFGAKLSMKMDKPGGKIGHAEMKIGDTRIMIADECAETNARSPQAFGGSSVSIHLYTKNVDNVVKGAVAAGAKLLMPVQDQYYGDRSGSVEDPFGHRWHIATHIEDVTPATLKKRAAAFAAEMSKKK